MTVAARRAGACTACEVHAESTFHVEGMDCHEEVAILERRLKGLVGVESLSADVVGQRLHVQYDAARLSTSSISDAVADTGMRAWLEHEEPKVVGKGRGKQALLSLAGAALLAGLAAEYWLHLDAVASTLYLVAVAAGGVFPARRAWTALRTRSIDINVLMSVAVLGALLIGEWSEAASVVCLFALAQYLETRSMDRARHAIRALLDLTPPEALVIRSGAQERVPIDQVRLGERVLVRPGDKIPLDGRVVGGSSEVNQAPITGESLPIAKHPGDDLYAGSINGRGALELEVTRLTRDTTLARIIHLVDRAQAQRAPLQTFVDRFARIYTPVVVAVAVLVAVVPPLALAAPTSDWLYRALVLLVIACPCALVISTPVSIVSALAAAARKGVLIKGGIHLERTALVRCVAFDKTGTLTRGTPHVAAVLPLDGQRPDRLLELAASAEAHSEHPIGAAIVRAAFEAGLAPMLSSASRALPGLGTECTAAGKPVLVGNARLFRERGLLTPELERRLDTTAASGQTGVLVAYGGEVLGVIAVSDRPREAARDVLDLLRDQAGAHIVMLTGDAPAAAGAVAADLGIEDVRAALLPQDKVAAVQALKETHGTVAMVGDGVNDAPALAHADVGMVMGAAGSDAALETADVALMGDDLSKIPFAIRLSRATVANIRTNVALSLAVKAIFLALVVTGSATLWMAIVADTGTSLLVIANGLRLLRID
jgi:Zn2+/Cd2+-exporting ATPase